jgi:hypothetical protein
MSVTRLLAAPVLAVLSALLLAGCGDDAGAAADKPAKPTTSTAAPSKQYTIEQLATELGGGCKPKFPGPTKDFRKAFCDVDGDEFVLLQFDTSEGQEMWLDRATSYGGIYLVGDRWGLSGRSEAYMRELQKTMGGAIRKRSD